MLKGYPMWRENFDELNDVILSVKESGFDYVELSMDYPLPEQKEELERFVEETKKWNLYRAYHAPWRGLHIGIPWERVRKAVVDFMKDMAFMSRQYLGEYMVIHISVDEKVNKKIRESLKKKMKESIEELTIFALENKFEIYFENVVTRCCTLPEDVGEFADQIEGFKLCWDVGHAVSVHILRGGDVEDIPDVLDTWSKSLWKNIRCVHVHDVVINGRKVKSHRPVGFTYTVKDLVKAVSRTNAQYMLLEIFYDKEGEELNPKKVGSLLREINTWLRVYGLE